MSKDVQCMWSAPNVDIYDGVQSVLHTLRARTYEVIAVVVSFLASDTDLNLIISSIASSLQEVLWQ